MTKDETERYYLFPGQGGRARQRKIRTMLVWGITMGVLTGAALAGCLYLISYLASPVH